MKEKIKAFVAEKRAVSPVIGVMKAARNSSLYNSKRAVSPVIGVVLMVAVVVILAAVIGAFVLGLGGSQDQAPQASFVFDEATGTLTMSGGDTIDSANLYYSIDGAAPVGWGGTGDVSAGSSVTGLAPTESIKVIYDDGTGDTATLASLEV